VRTALGADRSRIIRQVLTESFLLALAGSIAGALLAVGGVQALRAIGPADIPRLEHIRIDAAVFAFTLGLAVVTGVLFGVGPAIRASRLQQMPALKQAAGAPSSGLRLFGRSKTRSILATCEIALAMVLLVGAGLLINSFLRLSSVNPGYDATNVLSFRIPLPQGRYPGSARQAFFENVLDRLRALPGVRFAAISNTLPLQRGITRLAIQMEGRPAATRPEDMVLADLRVIDPDYPATMGIRLKEGRTFASESGAAIPRTLLVNETFVRRYVSAGHAIGTKLDFDGPEPWEVIGVVGDVRHAGLTADPVPEMYVDYRQTAMIAQRGLGDAFFTIRTSADPRPLIPNVRGLVRQLDSQLVIDNVATMEQRLATSIARPRFYAALVGVFAVVAIALAAIGVYGVLAYAVSQCTREIGIRIALGAPRGRVLRLVLAQGSLISAVGIVVGFGGAALLAGSLKTLLYDIPPFDPATFAAVATLLGIVALLACLVPALRATRIDPIVALRTE
jgi:putative ABC transport system permease protein